MTSLLTEMKAKMKNRPIGRCPKCGFGVLLGTRNRVLAHPSYRPSGNYDGPCPGQGRVGRPLDKGKKR